MGLLVTHYREDRSQLNLLNVIRDVCSATYSNYNIIAYVYKILAVILAY